ncbi:MAG: CoA-binding protein [Serpentinimonas sp.]|nr:CoA-binding protein [Serpentinimonas sp.]MDO9611901.1 CoA-binding protein [Serpentinimonas sp.]
MIDTELSALLRRSHTVAVVGLSPKPERPSHRVAQYLLQQGYRVLPVNPLLAGETVLGQPCYVSLEQAAAALAAEGLRLDVVDVFRQSAEVPPLAEAAIALGAATLWLQLGVVHLEAEARAAAAGLQVVRERCIKIEHQRLLGSG